MLGLKLKKLQATKGLELDDQLNERRFFKSLCKELEEIEVEIKQEREIQFSKLYTALDYLKNKEVLLDSWNGLIIYKPFNNFTYNLIQNKNEKMLLDFNNEDEEFTSGITVKLDDIENIDIDDNTGFMENGMMNHYECESIIITLINDSILRIGLEW